MKNEENLIELAKEISMAAHKGQFRKNSKEPYFEHPRRVAESFSEKEWQERIVGYLHDTVEDTNATIEGLKKLFPENITAAIDLLTRKKDQNYLDFILNICSSNNELAIKVKLADLKDNMRDLNEGSLKDKYRMAEYIFAIFPYFT